MGSTQSFDLFLQITALAHEPSLVNCNLSSDAVEGPILTDQITHSHTPSGEGYNYPIPLYFFQ